MSLSLTQDNPALATADIQSMAATLVSYDHMFGPQHPQTLSVMGHLGRALWRADDSDRGRALLERAAHGLSQRLPLAHPARITALAELGELLFEARDFMGACLVQREVLKCRMEAGGPDHPDTVAAGNSLASTLFELGHGTPATGFWRQPGKGKYGYASFTDR